MGYHSEPFGLFVKFWLNFDGFQILSFFKNFTHSLEKIFILANCEIKAEQIIFQIGTYKPASFLNYAKYRVKFSKNWVRQMGLYSVSYLPKLTSTILSRTLLIEVKILYYLISPNFWYIVWKIEKFPFYTKIRQNISVNHISLPFGFSLEMKAYSQMPNRYIICSL